MSDRQYKDVAGNPCTLLWLVMNEPEWAENQIRHRDALERELAEAKTRIARLEEALDTLTVVIGSTRVSGDLGALQNAMDQALVVLGNKEAQP